MVLEEEGKGGERDDSVVFSLASSYIIRSSYVIGRGGKEMKREKMMT